MGGTTRPIVRGRDCGAGKRVSHKRLTFGVGAPPPVPPKDP